jgi:hypothetical protein
MLAGDGRARGGRHLILGHPRWRGPGAAGRGAGRASSASLRPGFRRDRARLPTRARRPEPARACGDAAASGDVLVEPVEHALFGELARHRLAVVANAPTALPPSRELPGASRPLPGCGPWPPARASRQMPTLCSRWATFRGTRRSKRCCGRMPRQPRRRRGIQQRSGRARRPMRPFGVSARARTRHASCQRPRTARPPTR